MHRCLHIFTYKCSLQWVVGLVWGPWLLEHYQYWMPTGSFLRYPVVALCHGDPAAFLLQDQPLLTLQQFTGDADAGLGQLKALDGSRAGQPTCPLPDPTRASSPTHCCVLGAGPTALPRQGTGYYPKHYDLRGAGVVLLHPSHRSHSWWGSWPALLCSWVTIFLSICDRKDYTVNIKHT